MQKHVLRPMVFICALILCACENSAGPTSSPALAAISPYLEAENTPPAGRLPDLARPLAYRLALKLDPRSDTFSGKVTIEIELQRSSDVIWLHGKKLRVSSVLVQLADGTRVPAQYEELLDSGVAAVRFPQLLPGGPLSLELQYEADFDRNLGGLFKVEEQGEAYVLAKSESIAARRYLPSFDEPGLKATYDVNLTIPAGYQAITNSPELHRRKTGNGMELLTFARTRPMPTYLLSLAVGPFDVVEREPLAANEFRSEPIPLRGFARKGRGADLEYILDITPRMVEIFEHELKRGYPFAKLDIIAAPQWPSGATELSAAITYREQIILVGDNPAPGARLGLVSIHAHELSHMWFGNLVTPPWWDDLWLKEGFATWGTPLVLSIMEPEAGHDISARSRAIRAMALDSLASTRAIREPIGDNHNIRNAYDAITYSKSLGVIHMVDQYFGADLFRPALGRYVAAYADSDADSQEFYKVIGEQTGRAQLTETFRSFVEQKGVPQVDVTLECTDGKVNLRAQQQRYRPLGSAITGEDQSWSIPLCVQTSSGENHCEIMREPEQTLQLHDGPCPKWVLPNAGGNGYYRWSLAEPQWLALIEDFDQLSPTAALSTVDSALASFEAGRLRPALVWQLVEVSSRSPYRQVVVAPFSRLEQYAKHYFSDAQQVILGDRLRLWYNPVLAAAATSQDPEQQLLHANVLGFMALVARDRDARKQLLDRVRRFTGFGSEPDADALSSDLYEAALSVGLQEMGADFLTHLVKLRKALDDPRFESASARAIGRVTDPALLEQVHSVAMSDEMGPRETFDLLRRATATVQTQDANWLWVRTNFAKIAAKIPAQWRRKMPLLAAGFCSEKSLLELQELFVKHADLTPGHERALAQTRERLTLCVALNEQGRRLAASL